MKGNVTDDVAQRLLALRAVIAEAISAKAPRRAVACPGAAVTLALFGAAAPSVSPASTVARSRDTRAGQATEASRPAREKGGE